MESPETRIVSRWLCNPAFVTYRYWREIARAVAWGVESENPALRAGAKRQKAVCLLAERLQEGFRNESAVPCSEFDLYRELINAALDNIDWPRVADTLFAEYGKRAGKKRAEHLSLGLVPEASIKVRG